MLVPALFLSVLAPSIGAAEPPPPPRIEVLEGRATLTVPEGIRQLRAGEPAPLIAGETYLELPARARVSVRWRDTASLLIHGPASLEWGPGRDRHRLEWRVVRAAEIHLEVRRGPVLTRLPGNWTAALEMGASFLTAGPGGSLDLHHDAGLPIHLVAPHAPQRVRPPVVVLAGARVRLIPGEETARPLGSSRSRILEPYGSSGQRAPDAVAAHRPWRGFTWPWASSEARAVEATLVEPAPASGPQAGSGDLLLPLRGETSHRGGGSPAAAPTGPSGTPATPLPPEPQAPTEAAEEAPAAPRGPPLDPELAEVLRWLLVPPLFPPHGEAAEEAQQEPGAAPLNLVPRVRRDGRLHLTPYGADWDDGF
jgi:hypothetical protein